MSYTPPPPPPGYGPSGYGPSGYGPPGMPGQPPRQSPKAVWSLVLGIASLPFAMCCSVVGLVGIAAIVLGSSARKEIAASGGALTGQGMAQAGFVLGIIGTALSVLMIGVGILLAVTGNGDFSFDTYN